MEHTIVDIEGRTCHIVQSCGHPVALIVKPLGEFERLLLLDECKKVSELTPVPFVMVAFEVAEPDIRKEGAERTFEYLNEKLLPYLYEHLSCKYTVIGGYSLGGIFALWCGTILEGIDAVYAGSPSLWMDGWDEYADENPTKARFVYMSLGDKEECTRKQPYCIIGERVRKQHERHLEQLGENHCVFEWNEGGHFNNIEKRKSKGFAWCLNTIMNLTF